VQRSTTPPWDEIRRRASVFPEAAFQFVREALAATVKQLYPESKGKAEAADSALADSRHVTGQQLCLGMRDLALKRYGLLAGAVMRQWGVRETEDFGVIVYAMIDRGEMRCSERDSFDDFRDVFAFDEVFSPMPVSSAFRRPGLAANRSA
jgi:uncharacterized repeat protein (TIGR04138 family)